MSPLSGTLWRACGDAMPRLKLLLSQVVPVLVQSSRASTMCGLLACQFHRPTSGVGAPTTRRAALKSSMIVGEVVAVHLSPPFRGGAPTCVRLLSMGISTSVFCPSKT
eukprot:scaffold91142_cov38-Prasinocladus_malaysianus.AAC.2